MRTASTQLRTDLATQQSWFIADLYTFLLIPNNRLFRWSNTDYNVTVGGNTFLSTGPKFEKVQLEAVIGLSVNNLSIQVEADATDIIYDGLNFLQLVARGDFDRAQVQIDRCFMLTQGVTTDGTIRIFNGTIGNVSNLTRVGCQFDCNSLIHQFNVNLPQQLIQPGCQWTLYGAGCALNKAAFAVAGTTANGSATSLITAITTFSQATGYFDMGMMTYNTGANAGLTRTIKTYTNPHTFEMASGFPYIPQNGDTFTVYPGCDKTLATCTNKFNNATRFAGEPFVPAPETAI